MGSETKERTALAWPDGAADPEQPSVGYEGLRLEAARAALAREWQAANPKTPEEIALFYQHAAGLADDLDAWHALPQRQEWTRMLVHVAKACGARQIVDVGAGLGHDLRAIGRAMPTAWLWGVEPNDALRAALRVCGIETSVDAAEAPIERTDLLICIDVLEHVPDPESFLAGIARRAPIGCLLVEASATHDTGTPLHLPQNRGWHPGRALEQRGWEQVDRTKEGRVRVWRRTSDAGSQRASLLLCAYRSVALGTLQSLLGVCADPSNANRWRLKAKGGDALIARSRNIILSAWSRETNDDVLLMVDDDICFSAQDADRLVELCRGGKDVVCGAYPVHDGAHLACRFLPGTGEVSFGPGQPPLQILYAASGFMAVHRRVLDALVPHLPLCHPDQVWSFYPFFEPRVLEGDGPSPAWLSEDFAFSALAREHGFTIWLDPQTILSHAGEAAISVRNMAAMHAALQQV